MIISNMADLHKRLNLEVMEVFPLLTHLPTNNKHTNLVQRRVLICDDNLSS